MRISDWSSDVCSSDLKSLQATVEAAYNIARFTAEDDCAGLPDEAMLEHAPQDLQLCYPWLLSTEEAVVLARRGEAAAFEVRSDERRVGKEGVRTGRSRWSPYH